MPDLAALKDAVEEARGEALRVTGPLARRYRLKVLIAAIAALEQARAQMPEHVSRG